jgi:hypothetical protein
MCSSAFCLIPSHILFSYALSQLFLLKCKITSCFTYLLCYCILIKWTIFCNSAFKFHSYLFLQGIQIESLLDDKDEEASSSPTGQCTETEEFRSLLRQQKVLNTLTEQALRKSQPLVISNINKEKAELMTAEDLKGLAKIEQLFLQVLSMCIFPGGVVVDVPCIDSSPQSPEGIGPFNGKNSSPAAGSAIPETDLPEIVSME